MAIRFRIPRRQATWALSCCNIAMCRGTRAVGTRRGLEAGLLKIAWNRKNLPAAWAVMRGKFIFVCPSAWFRRTHNQLPATFYRCESAPLLALLIKPPRHGKPSGLSNIQATPPSVICIPKNSKRVVRWVTRSWIGNKDHDPGASVCSGVSSLPTGRLACCI